MIRYHRHFYAEDEAASMWLRSLENLGPGGLIDAMEAQGLLSPVHTPSGAPVISPFKGGMIGEYSEPYLICYGRYKEFIDVGKIVMAP